jgi:formyl-CoA transferase/CoA:oxalate CoA-transferase
MGIGESDVRALNPDVVYASLSSYGWWEGWRSPWRGREELGQAVSGMELRWGGRGEAPRMQPFALNDYGAGNWAAVGIMAALLHRLRGGEPQHVHASLAHTATFHMAPFMVTVDGVAPSAPEGQGATGTSPTNRLYRAADRWFFLAAPDSRREALATLLGLPGPSSLTEETLEARFAGAPAEVWVECLVEGGVAAHVVLSTDEVMEDPRVKARGLSVVKDLPGSGPTRLLGSSPRLSRTPPAAAGAPGAPGADALEVLDSIGLDSELGDLEAAGVVYTGLASGVELVGRVRAAI